MRIDDAAKGSPLGGPDVVDRVAASALPSMSLSAEAFRGSGSRRSKFGSGLRLHRAVPAGAGLSIPLFYQGAEVSAAAGLSPGAAGPGVGVAFGKL